MTYGIIDIVSLRQEQNPVYPTLPSVSCSSRRVTATNSSTEITRSRCDTLTDISARNGGKEGLRLRSWIPRTEKNVTFSDWKRTNCRYFVGEFSEDLSAYPPCDWERCRIIVLSSGIVRRNTASRNWLKAARPIKFPAGNIVLRKKFKMTGLLERSPADDDGEVGIRTTSVLIKTFFVYFICGTRTGFICC